MGSDFFNEIWTSSFNFCNISYCNQSHHLKLWRSESTSYFHISHLWVRWITCLSARWRGSEQNTVWLNLWIYFATVDGWALVLSCLWQTYRGMLLLRPMCVCVCVCVFKCWQTRLLLGFERNALVFRILFFAFIIGKNTLLYFHIKSWND